MAQTSDDERLLSILEPAVDESLPPGYVWGRPLDMCIGPPIEQTVMVKRGRKIVSVSTPESRKAMAAYRTMKWPVLDRNSPLAEEIFEKSMRELDAFQQSLVQPSAATAKPAVDARPILVRR